MNAGEYEPNPCGAIRGTIRPPGSKSITNRAFVCAALARGTSHLSGCLASEDTRVMLECLRTLGIDVRVFDDGVVRVTGCGNVIPAGEARLWVANSGTTIRFLTAVAATGRGTFRFDGNARMRERPIGDLISALQQLGVDATARKHHRFPPVTVRADGLPGGTVRMKGDVSSQYLSGLLMAAPAARSPITIELQGAVVSRPYVDMTIAVMKSFGVEVERPNERTFEIAAPDHYRAVEYDVEPDASAASYFWAAAAVTGGKVTVEHLSRRALQGDVRFVDCLHEMGCRIEERKDGITVVGRPLRGIDVDMSDISDTVPTLAVVALFARGATTIRGVEHIRHKESDRIADVSRELRKLGADVAEHDDGMTINPKPLHAARIATYDDHRIAMSFAIAGLKIRGVVIEHPSCVEKTYPEFFQDLRKLTQG